VKFVAIQQAKYDLRDFYRKDPLPRSEIPTKRTDLPLLVGILDCSEPQTNREIPTKRTVLLHLVGNLGGSDSLASR
jgi:hypothetical protein